MSISFVCTCGKRMKARAEFAGKQVRCPQCGAVLAIPTSSADSAPATSGPTPTLAGAGATPEPAAAWAAVDDRESNDALDLPWLRSEEQGTASVPQPQVGSTQFPAFQTPNSPAGAGGGVNFSWLQEASTAPAPSGSGVPPQAAPASQPMPVSATLPVASPSPVKKPAAKPAPVVSARPETTAKLTPAPHVTPPATPQQPQPAPPPRRPEPAVPVAAPAPVQKPAPTPAALATEPAQTYAVAAAAEPVPVAAAPVLLPNLIVEEAEPLSPRTAKSAAATGSEEEAMPRVSREPWYVPFVETVARFLMAASIVCTVAVPALLLIGGLGSVAMTGDPRAFLNYRLGTVPVAYSLLGLFAAMAGLALLWAAPMLIVLDLSRRMRVLSRRLDSLGKPPGE